MASKTVRVEICTTPTELATRRQLLLNKHFNVVCTEEGNPDLVIWKDGADDAIGSGWVLVGIKD